MYSSPNQWKIEIIIAKYKKSLKNGQIILDLSDKPAVQNAPDNNIINDNSIKFKANVYRIKKRVTQDGCNINGYNDG